MKVSAVLITRDAEAYLDRCLASLAWCDEIVVRDQGSTDRTLEICAAHGARVIQGEWLGFGPTKAAAAAEARNRWVLSIDSDEEVTPELRDAVAALPDDPPEAAFRVNRISRFLGRWIRHCGWFPDRIVRLFDRERAGFDDARVHEAVRTDGPVADLPGLLRHYAYDDFGQFLRKQDHYTTLGAESAYAAGRRSSLIGALIRAKFTFLRAFAMRGGWMDGWHGAVLCSGMAFSTLMKYVKIWQAGRRPADGS